MGDRQTRRSFLKGTTKSVLGFWLLRNSKSAWSYQANEKLNIACIGVGGHGLTNLKSVSSENIVALCDVDEQRAANAFKIFPDVPHFQDFRKMFDELHQKIDAVVVSTPDHTHAVAVAAALRLGKHVYCEKPLTWSVYEARVLRELADRTKVVTQMGNQGTATEGFRRAVELVWVGVIGEVKEVHAWVSAFNETQDRPTETPPVPPTLNWDLWLGPAPYRPYHPAYVPYRWRHWRDFGTGQLGNWGCHTLNVAFMGLGLESLWLKQISSPSERSTIKVEATSSGVHHETYPRWIVVRYSIPRRNGMSPLVVNWYHGGQKPPQELLLGYPMPDSGCLLVGAKGSLLSIGGHNTRFVLLPQKEFEGFEGPAPTLPRTKGHHLEWIEACKGRAKPMSHFGYASRLTEFVLLGNVALFAGGVIEYDLLSGKVVNPPKVNELLHRNYREGWTL
ncbi:MAG: Gfo/Idh/MocA family protein [Candidatus Fervidibacter sp.]|uniref:Gfo/Idh/MocA family protein n=1 Tax=Candidatus Fervidibacter sp. TaxID=3100871 RepID=UPI00404AFCBA